MTLKDTAQLPICSSRDTNISNLRRSACYFAVAITFVLTRNSFAASPDFKGMVLHNSVTAPVTVPAGGQVHGLAFASGNIPSDGTSYSAINRAIVFVTAGAAPTTCIVGLSDGAMKSAAVTVPPNTTIAITVEDTGGDAPPGWLETTGFVIYAGAGGGFTVQPGSLATKTVFATQPKNNEY
jgi:hypothetical protein